MTGHTISIAPRRTFTGFTVRVCQRTVSMLGILGLASTTTLYAAGQTLPEAAAVLDKYVEATGGRSAYERVHNRVLKKRVIHVDMGFEDSLVEYQAMPNKRYVEIESDALGQVRQGTDGETAWYWSEQVGPMVEEGEPLAAALDSAAFDRALNWRAYYKEAKCVGIESVDGRECYKIVLTPNHGQPETHFYERQSNLLVKAEKTRLFSNMPSLRLELTFSDYRMVDDLLLAHKTTQSFDQCGAKRELVFVTESVEHNVDLPPDRFEPPANVQAIAVLTKGAAAVKKVLSADVAQGPKSTLPPCGAKTSVAPSKPKTKERKCCGGN